MSYTATQLRSVQHPILEESKASTRCLDAPLDLLNIHSLPPPPRRWLEPSGVLAWRVMMRRRVMLLGVGPLLLVVWCRRLDSECTPSQVLENLPQTVLAPSPPEDVGQSEVLHDTANLAKIGHQAFEIIVRWWLRWRMHGSGEAMVRGTAVRGVGVTVALRVHFNRRLLHNKECITLSSLAVGLTRGAGPGHHVWEHNLLEGKRLEMDKHCHEWKCSTQNLRTPSWVIHVILSVSCLIRNWRLTWPEQLRMIFLSVSALCSPLAQDVIDDIDVL